CAYGYASTFMLEETIKNCNNRDYFDSNDLSLQELFNTSKVYGDIKGPTAVDSRYFTEDISEGLVFWSNLGRIVNVSTPNIDSVITIGGTILDRDFYQEGLTLEKIGLADLSKDNLINSL